MLESYLLAHETAWRLGLFLAVLAAMACWEHAAPRRRPQHSRLRRWRTNLGLVALNAIVLRVMLPASAVGLAAHAAANGWGLLNHAGMDGWVSIVFAVIALDFVIWAQHVLFHAVPALAILHQVHHADPDFDATTGIRFHPIEIVLSMLIKFAAIVALGAPPAAVLVFEIVLNLSAMFNHGNVRIPLALDRVLRVLVVTPDMHRIHHSVVASERNSNYGFCLAVWDRLLGTYVAEPAAGQEAMTIGMPNIPDSNVSTSLGGALAIPFGAGQRASHG